MIIWKVNCGFFDYYVKQLPTCIIDNKTNKMYNKFFKIYIDSKEKYPKERFFIESKPERYTIINNETPFKIEYVRNGFWGEEKERRVYSKMRPAPSIYEEKPGGIRFTAWEIDDISPTIFTGSAVDYIRDKETGIEYTRGKMVFQKEKGLLAEDTNKYEFIYEFNQFSNTDLSTKDYLRDIWVNSIFKK